MPTPKAKRKAGRPKKADRPVNAEVLEEIGRLFLRGKSAREIALAIAVSETSVRHHLEQTVKPLWRNRIQWDAAIEVARADEVIRLAFAGYELSATATLKERHRYEAAENLKRRIKSKAPQGANLSKEKLVERLAETTTCKPDPAWLLIIVRMMDFKAKVKGGYAPARLHIKQESELRVAGLTPAQLEEKMLNRIAGLLGERQRHRQIIDAAARNAGGE